MENTELSTPDRARALAALEKLTPERVRALRAVHDASRQYCAGESCQALVAIETLADLVPEIPAITAALAEGEKDAARVDVWAVCWQGKPLQLFTVEESAQAHMRDYGHDADGSYTVEHLIAKPAASLSTSRAGEVSHG